MRNTASYLSISYDDKMSLFSTAVRSMCKRDVPPSVLEMTQEYLHTNEKIHSFLVRKCILTVHALHVLEAIIGKVIISNDEFEEFQMQGLHTYRETGEYPSLNRFIEKMTRERGY
jgi:hypothetical protein